MLGREVVKGKEHFFIFCQTLAGFWEFDLVTGDKLLIGCQSCFSGRSQVTLMDKLLGFALNTLRHFIQNISGPVDPATLLSDGAIFLLQSDPEAQRSVTNGQFG